MMRPEMAWIEPNWPAPRGVRALSTTRQGGISQGPYRSLNLAAHVGDDSAAVAHNRALLVAHAGLPAEPDWLRQVHGCAVATAGADGACVEADAVVAERPGLVCAVLTADCLPVLLCDRAGERVAAVHAGWRGLADGVIEAAVSRMGGLSGTLLAWLGPAIGPDAFEVGAEVRERFIGADPAAQGAFRPRPQGKWLADLYRLARQRLARAGVSDVWGGEYCTYRDAGRFFSYRRDRTCGRMATLIWRVPS
ncbi:uncharacterized protein, YfiH family [Thioflavicoccus mobilis 8321]|uniref:Purine nucleoside phosphorylase n=1 Tax=Thioflavicoccus mobilis 8321 TaxID=765912 RepID=L0GVY0_9GAMM|nr:peptidoglycan editing factor PgeF [Thioflavicoccus mobilis]AGA90933.1 uncharacterized protein, YfiH family [Thioflavicoccus mobilis 8321]